MLARGFFVVFAVVLASCAGRFRVDGVVEHPAELPVRAFAPVVVAADADPESTEAGNAIAAHLAQDGTIVGLAGRDPIEPGIRVDVRVRFTTSAVTRWGSRPENVCGPYGCYVRQVSYPYDEVSLVGEATVRVVDPSTNRALAERTARSEDVGNDQPARRALLMRRLLAQVRLWFDPREEDVAARLPRLGGDAYDRAIEFAHDGRWDDAVREIRSIRDDSSFSRRPVDERARVLEALSLAIRFSGEARRTPVRSLEEALALATESESLETSTERRALRDALARQLEEARVLEVQRGALGAESAESLEVPEAYR